MRQRINPLASQDESSASLRTPRVPYAVCLAQGAHSTRLARFLCLAATFRCRKPRRDSPDPRSSWPAPPNVATSSGNLLRQDKKRNIRAPVASPSNIRAPVAAFACAHKPSIGTANQPTNHSKTRRMIKIPRNYLRS